MIAQNASIINTDTDSLTNNSNISQEENNSQALINSNNNKAEQIKLRRNLIQSKYPLKKLQSPNKISEDSSLIQNAPEKPNIELIDYQKAYNYFKSQIYPNGENKESKNDCCSCGSEKIKLQKKFIMNLSKIKYNKLDNTHFRILYSIYYFFTKKIV